MPIDPDAKRILDTRYASGEISEGEYTKRLRVLSESQRIISDPTVSSPSQSVVDPIIESAPSSPLASTTPAPALSKPSAGRQMYVRNDRAEVTGPYSVQDLKSLARSGRVEPTWFISENRKAWHRAARIPGLFGQVDAALVEHLHVRQAEIASPQEHQTQTSREDQVRQFLQHFAQQNASINATLPLIQTLWLYWKKVSLPSAGFITVRVTKTGVRYVQHRFESGTEREIPKQQIDAEIEKTIQKIDAFKLASAFVGLLWFALTIDFASLGGTIASTMICGSIAFLGFLYRAKKQRVYLGYIIDPELQAELQRIQDAFALLRESDRVWVYALSRVDTHPMAWKYNAGEMIRVSRQPAAIFNRSIPRVETNIRVNGLSGRDTAVYFLPEKVLVMRHGHVTDFDYSECFIQLEHLDYVEHEGSLYKDTAVIGERWKFINKDGSQDRRFKHNFTLPVVRCAIVRLQGREQQILDLMTSSLDAPARFARLMSNRVVTGVSASSAGVFHHA